MRQASGYTHKGLPRLEVSRVTGRGGLALSVEWDPRLTKREEVFCVLISTAWFPVCEHSGTNIASTWHSDIPAMIDCVYPSTVSQNKCFLHEAALVVVFDHSNRDQLCGGLRGL